MGNRVCLLIIKLHTQFSSQLSTYTHTRLHLALGLVHGITQSSAWYRVLGRRFRFSVRTPTR